MTVEIFTNTVFQQCQLDQVLALGHPYPLAKRTNRSRWVASPAHAGQRRHAGIIPAADFALVDQCQQSSLAHHRVTEIQSCELDLLRVMNSQLTTKPVVQRSMRLEFEGANRVRDPLDRIRLPMGPVIGWVDDPLGAGTVMRLMEDAIHHWIAQVDIR